MEAARSTPEEAGTLELPVNGAVTRVSRLLRFDGGSRHVQRHPKLDRLIVQE